jgi:PAS domain-containing protein
LENTRRALKQTLRGEPIFFETKRLTKNGRLLDSQLRTAILRDRNGAHTATIVIHRDITELKKAAEELNQYRHHLEELVELRTHEPRESEQCFRLVQDASPGPISVYDHQGKITCLNQAFEQTFGWSMEESTGPGIDFVPPHEAEKTRAAVFRTLTGENVLLETQRLTKSG